MRQYRVRAIVLWLSALDSNAARLSPSIYRNQFVSRFQLALVWYTR